MASQSKGIHLKIHVFAYIHSLERQFFALPIHIFERQIHVICSYFEKHFRAIFNIYAHLQSTWLPISHLYALFERDFLLLPILSLYIYMYMVKTLIFMLSCTQNQKLGFLRLSHIWALILAPTKLPIHSRMAAIHAQAKLTN